jgi:hypothetical protein
MAKYQEAGWGFVGENGRFSKFHPLEQSEEVFYTTGSRLFTGDFGSYKELHSAYTPIFHLMPIVSRQFCPNTGLMPNYVLKNSA